MNDVLYRLPPFELTGPVLTSLSQDEQDWGLVQFGVPDAWSLSKGEGVRVAVLDTGIDTSHVDLTGQILDAKDFTGSRSGVSDIVGHGTHVAGIIGAKENSQGTVGVCPGLSDDNGGLLIGKVLADSGIGRGEWIANGIYWAIGNKADVINLSLGSRSLDQRIYLAIKEAVNRDIPVVCAAGNSGESQEQDQVDYPARYNETYAIAAVGSSDSISLFSSKGPSIDVAAPGENILSTYPGNKWVRMSGTSMAAPFVSGVVALMASLKKVSASRVIEILKSTAKAVGPEGEDDFYGAGLVSPFPALSALINEDTGDPLNSKGIWVWVPGGKAGF